MDFLYLKAIHIVFVVSWFAGMFYLPRLFIYFVEAESQEPIVKSAMQNQFKIMQKRLWYGITWPAMIGTFIFGFWMVFKNYEYYLSQNWMLLKLFFVLLLSLYHFQCGSIRKQQANGIIKYTSLQLRFFNEVPTVLLVAIVFLVEFQNTLNWVYGVFGLIGIVVALFLAINIYKKIRNKRA